MYGDKLSIACYGDNKLLSKLNYFFKVDVYDLSDIKLDERIKSLRINLKYIFYNNPISEYFKNEESLLSERSLIYIYFLSLNNIDEYKNEKEYILNRCRESLNDENEEFIIIYAYNIDDNLNELKNIKKIKSDFSHNILKSIKILSLPILEDENYYTNKKINELYEHFQTRYCDILKICIEKKYSLIKNGYNKSLANFLTCTDIKKKTTSDKKKNNQIFKLVDIYVDNKKEEGDNDMCTTNINMNNINSNIIINDNIPNNINKTNEITNNIFQGSNEFVDFYKKHNVFSFCNEYVDIHFFLYQNNMCSYINSLQFCTDFDEQLYIDMYDNFLSVFMWNENLCLLYIKLNLYKKSYILYSNINKLFMKYLNVYIKKKKCIIHSSLLFEKNYLTIARYIREKHICSLHLLEYIFFKKITILLFLNKFSYISSKALKFSQFFYINKIFIFMHNFNRFKNNILKNSNDINSLRNIQKKIVKYKKKVDKRQSTHQTNHKGFLHISEKNKYITDHKSNNQVKNISDDETYSNCSAMHPRRTHKIISDMDEIFINSNSIDNLIEEDEEIYEDQKIKSNKNTNTNANNINDDYICDNNHNNNNNNNIHSNHPMDQQKDEHDSNNAHTNTRLFSNSKEKKKNYKNHEHSQYDNYNKNKKKEHYNNYDLNVFKSDDEKIYFLLHCCFMNKENYFAIYFYNLANLIKFLFERRGYFLYQEGYMKKIKSDKNIKKNLNFSKYLSLQKNIMKLGYKNNFTTKKKKSKKSLKIKSKRSNSIDESYSSQISSTISDISDIKNTFKYFWYNDFCINVSNIFKLSFVILKNILNIYHTYHSIYHNMDMKTRLYFFNMFLNYLEEKRFEKNMDKADLEDNRYFNNIKGIKDHVMNNNNNMDDNNVDDNN
ncbi:hypothetical protein PFTANZ_03891, partial [Plasmodium falciparum Tanzania (2000708)]